MATMLDRFLRTVRFEPVDRTVFWKECAWGSTIKRWLAEGMPREAIPKYDSGIPGIVYLDSFWGCDVPDGPELELKMNVYPYYETEVLAEDDESLTVRNALGIVQRTFKANPETSMPEFVEHPVKTPEDWQRHKKRFDPATPGRLPDNWGPELITELNAATYPLHVGVQGLYWSCRDFIGAEELLYAFYDQPAMVHDMMETLTDLFIGTLTPVLEKVKIHSFELGEDMAYRGGSLVSPAMFREFMAPRYKRLAEFLRSHEVAEILVDCDGRIDELLPLFIDCGVNAITPVEIQAGNDPIRMRKTFGESLVIHGAINKRALARDRKAIDQEMQKVPWLLDQGGYFPTLDHAAPHDIPYDNFCYYMDVKRRMVGA